MTDEEYFNDEEFREMLDDYERTVADGQLVFMDVDDLADIAEYYQLHERYDDAQRAIDRAIELQPDSIIALNYKAHEAIGNGDYQAAKDYLERMDDKQAPEYIYSRAEIMMAQGMTDEADQYLLDCVKDLPRDEYQDYVIDIANLWTEYGNSEKGMEWMLRAHPEETEDFKELMARTYFGIGAYDDSERLFNELLDKNPFQKRYWNALASTQYMKEDYSGAITSSEYAIAIDPDDPDALLAKANALNSLSNNEEAIKYYDRYLAKIPDDEFALLNAGSCLVNVGKYEEAIVKLQKAEELAATDSQYLADIYQELAFAYSELHKPETALFYIDKTLSMDCNQNEMLVIRGHILLSNNFNDEAEQSYKQAISQSGYDPHIILRAAISIYDNQYVTTAYSMLTQLLDTVSDDWNRGYSYMALCCHDLGRHKEYLHYLEEACRRNPEEAKGALGFLFPEGMSPSDYYQYELNRLNT